MELTEMKKYFGAVNEYADLDADKIAKALSKAITFNTVSYEDTSKMDGNAFKALHQHFEEAFPLVHKTMEKTVINDWSLLFYWKGSDKSLKPALFMSHLDVVPVMPGTEGDWQQPAFSGNIIGGIIWGRGSLDTKGMVVGELAAAEYLIQKGYTPKRGMYFCFGHDEETMGVDGSLAVMEHIKKQGIKLEYVMDEGGGFKMGDDYGVPGKLLAQIDIFEKGYIDVVIEANSKGGHSSRPGKGTALGKVAKALAAIEANQLTPEINAVVGNMYKAIASEITEEPLKSLVAGLDTNSEALAQYLCDNDSLAPMVHTTTAINMINGSPAPNVLPQTVKALINFRISPQDSCESILQHCIEAANDPELKIYMSKGMNPSQISEIDSIGYDAMKAATNKFFPDAIVVPGLVTGGTDCRYFEDICNCCYRYRPYIDNAIFHGTAHATDERCAIDGLMQGVKVILDVMVNTCF